MDLPMILQYSDKARTLLHETLAAHESLFDRPFVTTSQFTSIRQLLAHVIGAEERWLARIEERERPPRYEDQSATTLEAMWNDWEHVRDVTRRCLPSADLARPIHVEMPIFQYDREVTIEQILFHVFNHEAHHRAQISMLLQHFGADPPNFDFVLLLPFS